MVGRFVTRTLALALLTALAQIAYYGLVGYRTVPQKVRLIDDYRPGLLDVVYFGDSTTVDSCPGDADCRPLPKMIGDALPHARVLPITHYAYHMGLYRAFCRRLAAAERPPAAAVVPINLRSFSVQWDRSPLWQFEKEQFLIDHPGFLARAFWRPLAVFRAVELNPLSMEAFGEVPVYAGATLAGQAADFEFMDPDADREAYHAAHFIYRYQYALSRDHRRLEALLDVVRMLEAAGATPVLYITPIDYQTGERYHGPAFTQQIEANVAVIQAALAECGAEAIDLSRALPPDAFCYGQHIHEHLDQEGRAFVAAQILPPIRAALASRLDTPQN
ncbi:MAG: hypothetical protein JXR94_09950 [Candidatus Hydrogenedentes bacterium]|nr:hypothetical protein [Candidatus Hydrogenedentota bacterium]